MTLHDLFVALYAFALLCLVLAVFNTELRTTRHAFGPVNFIALGLVAALLVPLINLLHG